MNEYIFLIETTIFTVNNSVSDKQIICPKKSDLTEILIKLNIALCKNHPFRE
jgi:hypothetical protein